MAFFRIFAVELINSEFQWNVVEFRSFLFLFYGPVPQEYFKFNSPFLVCEKKKEEILRFTQLTFLFL